jgi:uncharacterized protein (TIGR02996 family)
MSESAAFLAAIREHPDEDGPRLVYADWLDEQGDPKGEFIRVQCERARRDPDDPRQAALAWREEELLDPHTVAWGRHLPSWVESCTFRRGFPHTAALSLSRFIEQSHRLFRAEPLLAGVAFDFTAPCFPDDLWPRYDFRVFAESPHVNRLTEVRLRCDNNIAPEDLELFLTAPLVNQLGRLELGNVAITDSALRRLPGPRPFERLEALRWEGDYTPPRRLNDLAARGAFPTLSELELARVQISDPLPGLLLGRSRLLRLEDCEFDMGTIVQHALAGGFERLRHLSLPRNGLGLDMGRQLGAIPEADWSTTLLPRLVRLDLPDNALGDHSVQLLTGFPLCARLRWLDLADNAIGDAGAVALADSPHTAGLRVLDLAGNRIGDAGARALARSPHLSAELYLDLRDNPIGPDGEEALRARFPGVAV